MNNKARHNLVDEKCRWRSDLLDGAGSFLEPLGQRQVMQIRQRETPSHQREIIHEICCLSCQLSCETTNFMGYCPLVIWCLPLADFHLLPLTKQFPKLPAPSSGSERHLHFSSIRLCLAMLFIISI